MADTTDHQVVSSHGSLRENEEENGAQGGKVNVNGISKPIQYEEIIYEQEEESPDAQPGYQTGVFGNQSDPNGGQHRKSVSNEFGAVRFKEPNGYDQHPDFEKEA